MLQDSVISSGDDTKNKSVENFRKKIEIRIFPLMPMMNSEEKRRARSTSRSRSDQRSSTLPKIHNKRFTAAATQSRRQFDTDTIVSSMTDMESNFDARTIDDESIFQSSFVNNRDSNSSKVTANNIKIKKNIRPSYNTEHEFLDRELFEIKSAYKNFKKKNSKFIKLETSDGDSFNEIEYSESLRDLIKEYEKKSKLNNIEKDILLQKTRSLSHTESYLTYTRRFLKFRYNFEKHIVEIIERMKDLYYDHISKCCCNFSSIDYNNLGKANELLINEIIEEEFFEDIEDESPRANSIVNSYHQALNKNTPKTLNINVIYENDNLIKQYNEIVKNEFHDINKILAKINSVISNFHMFVRMRLAYVKMCGEVINKIEIIIKTLNDWVKQDKKFLDNLTECIDHMQRKGKHKERRHLLVQSKLQIVQKKANKVHREIDTLRKRQNECIRNIDEMKKKIQFVEMECDRILYKISKQNLEIKEFDDIWNNNGYIKKFTEKNQYVMQDEKRLHFGLNRLYSLLEAKQSELKKMKKTIKSTKITIETLENEVKEKETANDPILKEYEKYLKIHKALVDDLNLFNSQIQQIEKAKKLKLSTKSYMNLQAGLLPSDE